MEAPLSPEYRSIYKSVQNLPVTIMTPPCSPSILMMGSMERLDTLFFESGAMGTTILPEVVI